MFSQLEIQSQINPWSGAACGLESYGQFDPLFSSGFSALGHPLSSGLGASNIQRLAGSWNPLACGNAFGSFGGAGLGFSDLGLGFSAQGITSNCSFQSSSWCCWSLG